MAQFSTYIPRLMCTQHPDATVKVTAEEEVHESIVGFTLYGCDEVMSDFEGKSTPYVQPRLIVEEAARSGLPIGETIFVTPRMPNPKLEEFDRAALTVTAAAAANVASMRLVGTPAVRWIILPMTEDLSVVLTAQRLIDRIGRAVAEEAGFRHQPIHLIPLLEDAEAQIHADEVIRGFVSELRRLGIEERPLRVMLGKSDSAVKYGHVASTVALRYALSVLHRLRGEGIEVAPIIGMGTPPFRGAINNAELISYEVVNYSGYWTVTIQSAIRYDAPISDYLKVREAVLGGMYSEPPRLDYDHVKSLVNIFSAVYRELVNRYAEKVAEASLLVPSTRDRVPWTQYGRRVTTGDGRVVNMPRAIVYTATWYILGIPPTLIDLAALPRLNDEQMELLRRLAPFLLDEIKYDLRFYDPAYAAQRLDDHIVKRINEGLDVLGLRPEPDPTYVELLRRTKTPGSVLGLGKYRKFLG